MTSIGVCKKLLVKESMIFLIRSSEDLSLDGLALGSRATTLPSYTLDLATVIQTHVVDNIIDMPGKGWCFVYVARYSYDPFQVCIVVYLLSDILIMQRFT